MPRYEPGRVLEHLRQTAPSGDEQDSDSRLIAEFAQRHSESAFAALVRRHGPLVLGVCRRVLRDTHAAEDAFQATFLVLIRRAGSLREPDLLANWLYGAAYRTAWRLRSRMCREPVADVTAEAWSTAPATERIDLRELLDAELHRLPARFRQAIILTYFEGRSPEEAARTLRCAPTTIKTWLARGREQLRRRLVRRGVGVSASVLAALLTPEQLRAAVSLDLRTATLRLLLGSGSTIASAALVQSLANEVLRTMFLLRMIPVLVVGVACCFAGGGLLLSGWTAEGPQGFIVEEERQAADPPAAKKAPNKDDWERKLLALNSADWRVAFQVGGELASLPPDEGIAILKQYWPCITKDDARQQLIKAWNFGPSFSFGSRKHPHLLTVLDLGMRDRSAEVQKFALSYLKGIAFQDFAEDFKAYEKWYAAAATKPLDEVRAASLTTAIQQLRTAKRADRAKRYEFLTFEGAAFREQRKLRQVAMDQGLVELLERDILEAARSYDRGSRELAYALDILGALEPGEQVLRKIVVPLLKPPFPPEVRATAARSLAGKSNAWAIDLLQEIMVSGLKERDHGLGSTTVSAAMALAEIGDPRVIPTMIAVIAADNTYDTVYGVGYFGLGKLTNVTYDETHNGDWWRNWWVKNRERFPPTVRGLEIPTLAKAATSRPAAATENTVPEKTANNATADIRDVPAQERKVGGDAQKQYFLIGNTEKAPVGGFPLLIVLPGGDGSANFRPFLQRVYKNALKQPWLLVQVVAPRWDDKQFNNVVWPTTGLPYAAARFTTEDLIGEVVQDVGKQVTVDPKRIYLLGWSSGGPPCYATLLRADSPIRGAFIAMSIYRPGRLPPLSNARGKRIYLLQSPDDQVTPIQWAENAALDLTDAGADVKFQRYSGGHGWIGDVWSMLRTGVEWLDQKPDSARPSP